MSPLPPSIPQKFRPFFWSADLKKLDLQEHKPYIIHQLLHYGDLDAYLWLKKTYSMSELREIFIGHPKRIYTDKSFNFVKKFLLNLPDANLVSQQYVQMVS